jgi:hypothetical protein
MSYRFKPGQQVTYNGPSTGGLHPGIEVEICRQGSTSDYYIVKVVGTYTTATYMVKDVDLANTYNPYAYDGYMGLDEQLPFGYNEDVVKKRIEQGECAACGKKREMSMFGLLDCSCSPPLPARW